MREDEVQVRGFSALIKRQAFFAKSTKTSSRLFYFTIRCNDLEPIKGFECYSAQSKRNTHVANVIHQKPYDFGILLEDSE